MWRRGSPCVVLPKEKRFFVRCDGVRLGCDRDASLALPDEETLLRGREEDAVDDLGVSSDSLELRSPYVVKGAEVFDECAEDVRGRCFEGARNPSYSKKSSWAPGLVFSFCFFLSGDEVPFPLENMFLNPD